MLRRLGGSEDEMLNAQSNLAITYARLGRSQESLGMLRAVYSGRLKLFGEDNEHTLSAANNYAHCLTQLLHFEEAKALYRKMIPVMRRSLGDSDELTLGMRSSYAEALSEDPTATLDDLREAVNTLEDMVPTARRVFGPSHPTTAKIERALRLSRSTLRTAQNSEAFGNWKAMHAELPPPPPSGSS